MGTCMHSNSKAIYNCTEAPEGFVAPDKTLLTYNPETNRLYISLVNYPTRRLYCDFLDKIEYAQFLHDASEIKIDMNEGCFDLPILKPNQEIPVIEVYLKK